MFVLPRFFPQAKAAAGVAVVGVELREVVVVVAGDQVDVEEDVVAAEAEAEVVVDQEWTTELN